MRCRGHSPIHPLCVHTGQAFRIMLLGEHRCGQHVRSCCLPRRPVGLGISQRPVGPGSIRIDVCDGGFQCSVLGWRRVARYAIPTMTIDMPTVNGNVIARVRRTASGATPAIVTFSTDWITTSKNTVSQTRATVMAVFRTTG